MHRLAVALALVATTAFVAAPARAENAEVEEPPERRPPRPPPTPNKEGEYTGAKPGVRPGANEGRPQKKPKPGMLSWIGFEATDGGATVWVQAASPLEVEQRVDGSTLVVHVTGARRMVRNLRRHIDTRFFENPLARITAKAVSARRARKGRPSRSAGIELRIAFKHAPDAAAASVRTEVEADGLHYVYLGFPPGTGAATPGTSTERDADAAAD